jgi:predicted ATPase
MLKEGSLQPDIAQEALVKRLAKKETQLIAYQNFWEVNVQKVHYTQIADGNLENGKTIADQPEKSLFKSLFGIFSTPETEPVSAGRKHVSKPVTKFSVTTPFQGEHKVKGLYIWGRSGTGKTFLTDLFFQKLDVSKKLKMHYFEFMDMIHKTSFNYSKARLEDRKSRSSV